MKQCLWALVVCGVQWVTRSGICIHLNHPLLQIGCLFLYVPPHVRIPSSELILALPASFAFGFLIHVFGSWLASFKYVGGKVTPCFSWAFLWYLNTIFPEEASGACQQLVFQKIQWIIAALKRGLWGNECRTDCSPRQMKSTFELMSFS